MIQDESVGIVSPKLLRREDPTILDSTGLFINRSRRPYDRGQGEVDQRQYDHANKIFGACGAAALYRRTMLTDLAFINEYFDEDFFTYYEDADLAWRAQMRGWKARYAPKAVAAHVRGWGDTLRKKDAAIKDTSGPRFALRNRWLMILKNDALRYFLLDLPFILASEISRLGYMIVFAPDALLGLKDILVGSRSALDKRKNIRGRMINSDASLRTWFRSQQNQHP
jgi:GT2 family glycosyltransferase